MNWLLVLIAAFKFIGITLLLLLALVVVVLLIVLLCGIKYEAKGDYKDGAGQGRGFVSYLFGLIRLDFDYRDNKLAYKLKIPFLSADKKKAKGKKHKRTEKMQAPIKEIVSDDDRTVTIMSKTEKIKNEETDGSAVKEKKKAEKKSFLKKIRHKFDAFVHHKTKEPEEESLFDRLMYYYREYDLKKLYKPLKRFFNRFVNAMGIRDACVDVIFGFDDPYVTGIVLGGGAAVSAFLPFRFKLRGNFEGEYLDANANITGRTCILALIIPVVRMVFEKPVWKLLMKLKG